VLAEILFFFDRGRLPAGKNKYIFTLERKVEALFESLLIIVNAMNVYVITKGIDFYAILMANCKLIATVLFCLGVLVVGIVVLAVWVWLNSLKYGQKERKRTRSENMRKYWRKKKAKKS
jgi:hypothetical protein